MALSWNAANVKPTTRAQAPIQRAAELAWGLHDDAQTAGRCKRDVFLPLAIECCKIVHCAVFLSGSWAHATSVGNLPPSFTKSMEDLLLILQDITDQSHSCQGDQPIIRQEIERYQRDLNRLRRTFSRQAEPPSAGDADGILAAVGVGVGRHALPWSPTSVNRALLAIAGVASTIYLSLLLYIPSLYSHIQGIRPRPELKSELEMQHLATRPRDNLGEAQSAPRRAMDPDSWDTHSRILVKEWAALRTLSGLVLATIFSMFQIAGLWRNQVMMVAAVLSFAALVYGGILTMYVNGWRDESGVPLWVRSTREPFEIGFLWNTWILLGLPAIWTTWGVLFFFLSVVMVWISAQGDNPNAQDLVHFTSGQPRGFAVAHSWFIPLFVVAVIYLVLLVYTLRGLSRHHNIRSPLTAV